MLILYGDSLSDAVYSIMRDRIESDEDIDKRPSRSMIDARISCLSNSELIELISNAFDRIISEIKSD